MAGASAALNGPHSHAKIRTLLHPSNHTQSRLPQHLSIPNIATAASTAAAAAPSGTHIGNSGSIACSLRLSSQRARDRWATSSPPISPRSESPAALPSFANALQSGRLGLSPRDDRQPTPRVAASRQRRQQPGISVASREGSSRILKNSSSLRDAVPAVSAVPAATRSMQWRSPSHAGGRRSADGGTGKAVRGEEAWETAEGNASFVGTALSQVVKLFLLSQLESCEDLSVTVAGSNRELLSGRIAAVTLTAAGAVYKGVRLTAVHVAAADIAVDARSQAERGSFLCHQFPVHVKAHVSEGDFNASLRNPSLHKPLVDLLSLNAPLEPSLLRVRLTDGSLHLSSDPPNADLLRLTPKLCRSGRCLTFDRKNGTMPGPGTRDSAPEVDLGPGTRISLLEVDQGCIWLHGTFTVIP
ncbi:hypothetical protein CLOM_g15912 [Closterium sp. NIES-68]|nr:hypothetical protein CLOM_g15912 [Closterium sp. NIES-68]